MKRLLTIKEEDVYPGKVHVYTPYSVREASRALLFDDAKHIALLHVTQFGYYKLPGGGIEAGESIKEALRRECREETGCEITIEDEIGEAEEFLDKWSLKKLSYCFFAKVEGEKGVPQFEKSERDEGFELVWVPLEKAIELVRNSKPDTASYDGRFIVKRDLAFLLEARRLMRKEKD